MESRKTVIYKNGAGCQAVIETTTYRYETGRDDDPSFGQLDVQNLPDIPPQSVYYQPVEPHGPHSPRISREPSPRNSRGPSPRPPLMGHSPRGPMGHSPKGSREHSPKAPRGYDDFANAMEGQTQSNERYNDGEGKSSGGHNNSLVRVLEAHNKYRKTHGVPPLALKPEVTKYSQRWAEELLRMRNMQHSPSSYRPNYGENIYWSSRENETPNKAVDSWYDELRSTSYVFGQEPADLGAGHFTQVVWKGSRYLGVGVASGDGGTFVVCNYEPAGNIIGQFSENVPYPGR